MAHPTPAEIKAAIFEALADDYNRVPYGAQPGEMTMPIRVHRIVNEAIDKACAAKMEGDRHAA